MNNKKMLASLVTASIAGLMVAVSSGNSLISNTAWADDDDNDHIGKYHSLKRLANAIDDGKFDDNHIKFSDFKHTSAWKDADNDERDCIKDAAHLGDNLADYEILECAHGSHGY